MMRNIVLSILMFLLLFSVSWAQESTMTITDMNVEPGAVNRGATALISCQVSHSEGPMFIEKVAATVFHGEWNTSYSRLYDDGTNGDRVADDEIYSLEINAPATSGEAKIVFSAVDKDRNEIESEAIILTVE